MARVRRHSPDRRIEAGVVQIAAPALLLTIEAALQRQLAGDRLAVNLQLQLVLLLAALGVEGQQADLQRILLQLLDAYRQLPLNLIRGAHVAVYFHAVDAQRLPLQAGCGQIRQQLRRLQIAAQLQQPFGGAAQARQRAVQTRRVDVGVQVPALLVQLPFDVQLVTPQRQIDAGDFPLPGGVAAQRTARRHLVLLHVAVQLQHRHLQLPAAAVQAAARGDLAIQLRRPFRPLFGGIDAAQRQLRGPADGLAPVHQRGEIGIALQRSQAQALQLELLDVAFAVQRQHRRRQVLAFQIGARRQRVVGRLAVKAQAEIVDLILRLAAQRPFQLLALQRQRQRQAGFGQPGLHIELDADRAGQVQRHLQLVTQPAADVQLHLLALQRFDVQRAVGGQGHRPVAGQRCLPLQRQRALRRLHVEVVQLDMLILRAGLQ